jgi:ATP-dependent protease Clp ATPase subunit
MGGSNSILRAHDHENHYAPWLKICQYKWTPASKSAHYPRLTDRKDGERSSFEEVRSIACSATGMNASFASSPPQDLARSGWQTPTRAFNVRFTIANAARAGHAAKTQNISLKLLRSVSYDVEHAQHGVVIDESVKQWRAATTLRSPA